MRPVLARAAALLLFSSLAALPLRARAWTDATVRSVAARVVIARDASAEVELVAQVRVDGGWLEAFEMDGLDPDLALLEERPATFAELAGRPLAPRIEHAGEGRVVLAFPRRASPRRGEYVATIAYRTSLAHRSTEVDDDGRVLVRWTLPSWRYGLDDVSITVDAPPGARASGAEADHGNVAIAVTESAAGTQLVFRRVHLPRTREWPVVVSVPASEMDASLRAPTVARRAPPPAPARDERTDGAGIALIAAFLALLAIAKNTAVARAAARSRVSSAALIPLGATLRSGLATAAAAGAALLAEKVELALGALVVVALLTMHRRSGAPRPPRLGSFRPTNAADHIRATRALRSERLGLGAWLDPTTVPGATVLLAIAAAPALAWAADVLSVPLAVATLTSALAGAMMLAGSRRSRPAPPLVDLAHLLALAARTRAALDDERRWALRPVLHADVRGEPQDARLRVMLASAPKGLLRLDVVRAAHPERGCWRSDLQLLVVAREGSPADRALEDRFPSARIAAAPRRVARMLPLSPSLARALAPVLEALASCPNESTAMNESETAALAASA